MVRAWETTGLLGTVRTGRHERLDYVCQQCGRAFHLEPWRGRLIGGGLFAVMFAGFGAMALVGGLIAGAAEQRSPAYFAGMFAFSVVSLIVAAAFAAWASKPWRTFRLAPVDPDATPLQMRFTIPAESLRRCGCGGVAQCRKIVAERTMLGRGFETHYECTQCGRTFALESARSAITAVTASILIGGLGASIAVAAWEQGPGTWACAGIIIALGLGGLSLSVARLVNRARHPAMVPT
jgi:DNA-directed RNA polymerase subunit RPC12/RpoP